MRIVADWEMVFPGDDFFRADQFETRFWVPRVHDAKGVDQDVNTFFASNPPDEKELFRLRLNS
jgi:hypothetical protein